MNRLDTIIATLKTNLIIGEAISVETTLTTLKKLRRNREQLVDAVSRKRSWKPSEKAAASADYMMESQALTIAITAIESLVYDGKDNSNEDS